MNAGEFIASVKECLNTSKEVFTFYYSSPESRYLYGFRSRHDGIYNNFSYYARDRHREWKMSDGIVMEITDIEVVIPRASLILVANVIISEINDKLTSRYGRRAYLHDLIIDPIVIDSIVKK